MFGSLSAFADDAKGSAGNVLDEAGILSVETKEYIDKNIERLSATSGEKIQFRTMSAAEAPTDGIMGFGTDDVKKVFIWVDGADVIRVYSAENPSGSTDKYKQLNKELVEYTAGIDDSQLLIKDSFSMLAAGVFYDEHQEDMIPETMTIGGKPAKESISRTMGKYRTKYRTKNMVIGISLTVLIASAIIFIFIKSRAPEGSVPGDGSNFKDGYGSGVAAAVGMPGQSDGVAGSGGIGRGMGFK